MTERPKPQPFDLTDQWAMLTGMELTEEQLNEPIDIVEHYKKKVEKPKVPADLAGSDPLVNKWPTKAQMRHTWD